MLNNPNLFKPSYFRFNFTGGKIYYPAFKLFRIYLYVSKYGYKTALEAENRAKEIKTKWIKLYTERLSNELQAESIPNS